MYTKREGIQMKYHIELDDEDYIEFNTFLTYNTKAGQAAITRGRFLGLAISALVMLILFVAQADKFLIIVEACMLAVFSIAVYVLYPKSVKKMLRKRIMKMKEEGKLAYVPESDLDFREDEIFEVRPDGERHIKYDSVMSVEETEQYVYVRLGVQEALVLPKRCLGNSAGDLVEFLKTKVQTVVKH